VVVERFLALAHRARNLSLGGLALAALAVGSWWVVGLKPFSAQATAAVLLAGVAAGAAGWAMRTPRAPAGRGSLTGWVVLAVVLAAWQLMAYVQSPRDEHPTVSSLTNAVLSSQPARTVAFVLWLGAMFGLARR
jgi:hypothetical protein